MGYLHETFTAILDGKNRSWKNLSNDIGVCDSSISEWGSKGKEISALSFAKISSSCIGSNIRELEECCKYLLCTYNREVLINIKKMFMIAYLNGYLGIQAYIVNMCKNHENQVIKKFGSIYALFYQRVQNIKTNTQIYLELGDLKKGISKKQPDYAVLCDILSLAVLGDKGTFKVSSYHKERALQNLQYVKNKELKSLYEFSILELGSYWLLRKDRHDEFKTINNTLRKYKHLECFPIMLATLNSRIGEAVIFECYEKSLGILSEVLAVYQERNCPFKAEVVLNNINFLKLYWNRDINSIDYKTLHLAERVFYWWRKGNIKKAMKCLKLLEERGDLSPTQLTYKGVVTENLQLISTAIDEFKSNNDFFFARFAIEMYELLKNKKQKMIEVGE
ncbi:hypothetical protein EXW59_00170 (plasmid) [Bacillus mycoides]|uniref:AimR family lysis-lysogeny pheromone receptor n=1 Tax=Bacillus mycoides TaxID=1405 RepID=UPI001C02B8E3|nr:AimR family lysis-lysogeny pheromone receptor [Bacillus mycoides]QWH75367.1 hypothetical protein EXW59_00170 [Bacillus mycoides]QWI47294.1 hypothetical protein EXW55_31245 [Bacillus mycoides]